MIDWGNETKPREGHSGWVGLDQTLKDARRGDLKAVRAHLRRDPALLHAMSGGHNRTFLWEAVRGGHREVVTFLLDAGADPEVPGRIRSETVVLLKPYTLAVRHGRTELAELLRPRTTLDLYSACFLGDGPRVDALLAEDPNRLGQEQGDDTVWRVTPLHYAVAGGHADLVRGLIGRGAAVGPYTRLLCNAAVRMGHPELVRVLLDHGADPDLARDWARLRPGE